MLRITITTSDNVSLKLEGRLVGPWVDELRNAVWRTKGWNLPLAVDVVDLTFADEDGEHALSWLHKMGARFTGEGPFSRYLFERLGIPLLPAEAAPDKRYDNELQK